MSTLLPDYPDTQVASHHLRLLADLEQQGVFTQQALKAAFAAVPRHRFLSRVFLPGATLAAWQEVLPPASERAAEWLRLVYQDQALVTRRDAQGMPSSSSSQPSAMARMLAALDVQPGERVLEIGAGTGYNAALLAVLAGDPALVTSVDLDPDLVHQAQAAVDQAVGSGATIVTANGFDGYPAHAPYARIIATASAAVPAAWLSQLQTGGCLVMNLRGNLGGAFLHLRKTSAHTAQGTFFEMPNVQFMGLHPPVSGPSQTVRLGSYLARPIQAVETLSSPEFQPEDLDDAGLSWFLQWQFPTLVRLWMSDEHARDVTCLVEPVSGMLVRLLPTLDSRMWTVELRGSVTLWRDITSAIQRWRSLGQPQPTDYLLEVDSDGRQEIRLASACAEASPRQRWTLVSQRAS